MLKLLTDSVENAIDVTMGIGRAMVGEDGPTKRQVAQLIADGMTVAAIAAAFDVTTDVIEGLIEE